MLIVPWEKVDMSLWCTEKECSQRWGCITNTPSQSCLSHAKYRKLNDYWDVRRIVIGGKGSKDPFRRAAPLLSVCSSPSTWCKDWFDRTYILFHFTSSWFELEWRETFVFRDWAGALNPTLSSGFRRVIPKAMQSCGHNLNERTKTNWSNAEDYSTFWECRCRFGAY